MSLIAAPSTIPDWLFEKKRSPEFRFLPDPHEYYERARRLWSPSGVFLHCRYSDNKYYTEDACYRGSYVHRTTHLIDEGDTGIWKKIYHKFLGFVEAYCEWKEVWRFKPRLIEMPIYYPEHLTVLQTHGLTLPMNPYATTPDREGLILQGDEAIIELKTGTMPWWTAIQTAAHDVGIHAWDKDQRKTRRRIGVELKPNGKFRAKEFSDDDDYYTWAANLKTCQRQHPQPLPKLTSILSY